MMKKTFGEFDKLDRKDFAERLTKAISIDYEFAEGSYVLSLNAGFGTGKTTFLEMWQNYLEQEGYKTILINAWETDFADDPIIPIISSFLKFLEHENSAKKKNDTKTKKILKKTLGALASTSNQLFDKYTGVNLSEVNKSLKQDQQNSLEKDGNQLFEDFKLKEKALEELRTGLAEYIDKLGKKPLIILVDELDRARPNYSVEFLEVIKHIFAIKGIAFVLAVDKNHLKSAMQVIYGQGLDFDGYYRRFALREATLPTFYNTNDFDNNNTPVGKFIENVFIENIQSKINSHVANYPLNIGDVKNIFKATAILFSLTLREIEFCFSILNHYLQSDNDNSQEIIRHYFQAAIFLIVLSIKNETLYHNFCNNTIKPNELYNYIKSQEGFPIDKYNIKHLIYAVFLSGFNTGNHDQYSDFVISTLMTDFGDKINDEDKINKQDVISKLFSRYFGSYFSYRLSEISTIYSIYRQLETWCSVFD